LAHTPDEGLYEHTELTSRYLELLVTVNQLDTVIDGLIIAIAQKKGLDICNRVKVMLIESITLHDLGKVNVNFQSSRMHNPLFQPNTDTIRHSHPLLGAYIFLVYKLDLILSSTVNKGDQAELFGFCLLFSYAISNHHKGSYSIEFNKNEFDQYINEFLKYINEFQIKPTKQITQKLFCAEMFVNKLKQYVHYIYEQADNDFSPWCLLKLQYSLLTASDYYATNHYKSSMQSLYMEKELGIISSELSDKMIGNVRQTKSYNKTLLSDHLYYLNYSLSRLQEVSFDNLCILRQKLGAELIAGIDDNPDERVFYIEAPTGGGKTNLSILAITRLLERKPADVTKIFYVFPFTTLITQTFTALKETFCLDDNEMIQIHSKAGFHKKEEKTAEENEDENERKDHIDYLFVNYPVCLMSHIKFFDIIKSNNKEANYILHRLANSIVVIDELQSYAPSEWDKLKYFISHYAKAFNMRFLIMSATLPKIHSLEVGTDIQFEPLIKDVQRRYLQNPNFKDRVIFDFTLLDKYPLISISVLADEVAQRSREYAQAHNTVHTIVEFIHKKSTTAFFEEIKMGRMGFSFEEIWILSGTILEPRRKEIINHLKDKDNRRKNILLITTQVVEAGVDIDMDLGFKNISLLDSDEQLAGRVNRNAIKGSCKLYLFKKDEPFRIYKDDHRYEYAASLYLQQTERMRVLVNKDFNLLYRKVIEGINNNNKQELTVNFKNYIGYVRNLNYNKVDEHFKLIDNNTISIFVPLDIDADQYADAFTKEEYAFLERYKCLMDRKIIGRAIWKLYTASVKYDQIHFIKKTIRLKIIGGIMSKFVFSMYNDRNLLDGLKPFLEHEDEDEKSFEINGYYCLNANYDQIYDWERGLNEKLLKSESFIV
jgi:CRISPR-associated endonuclease/helicase Cas3